MGSLILNCDLGEDEAVEQTERLLSLVDAANIGCGYHAGNLEKTRQAIQAAKEQGVLIGAHPGLVDGGGRSDRIPTAQEFTILLREQVGRFLQLAADEGAEVTYIKLHGTLYHAVEQDDSLAQLFIDFLKESNLAAFALAQGKFALNAERADIRVYHEAFADRAYQRDGRLVPRSEPDSVLRKDVALERMQYWLTQGRIPTYTSESAIELRADTICVHGDSPDALEMIEAIREHLKRVE